MKLSHKLLLISAGFIFLSILIIFISVRVVARGSLSGYFQKDLMQKSEVLQKNVELMKERALHAVEWFEYSDRLAALIRANDRNGIIKLITTAMKSMDLDYITVTDRRGNVIARAHEPEKFGDSIMVQENIKKALSGEKSVGIEEGAVVKYSIRAGTPVKAAGAIAGAVSAGFILTNNEFVDRQKAQLSCDVTVFHGIERISTTLIKEEKRLTGTKLEHDVIINTVLKEGKPYYGEATILGSLYFTAYHPIVDVKGDNSGILFIGKESEIVNSIVVTLMKYLGMVFFLVGCGFMAGVYFALKRFLSAKLEKLTAFFSELAAGKGDLTKKIEISSMDEIGIAMSLFNSFIESLREIIIVVRDNSLQLAHSSEEITKATSVFSINSQNQAAATEEITATIEQVAAGMDTIADSARFQYEKIDGLMTRINELTSIIKVNAGNIRETVSLANTIEIKAHEGEKSLKDMNLNMSRITDSSNDMLSIVGIINDISEQINLLSLNAAIEAARAGDSGRGFAVVADEISKLADQTARSIKEIDTLIKSNNDEITRGMANVVNSIGIISSMIEGVDEIKKMIDRVYETTASQIETNETVNREALTVRSRAEEITLATQEHKSGVGEIVRSVSNVNELTQSIAGGAEELTSNSEEIAAMAETLKARVIFFKVD
jgi:methyl-accepting chemotaxis protein